LGDQAWSVKNMNKSELAEMNRLKEEADKKIPKYEKKIKEMKCQIDDLQKNINKNNPDVIIAMKDSMIDLFKKFPKSKFKISVDFGYRNGFTLETTDVCPI